MPSIVITGTGSYWPETVLTNEDLGKMVDTSDEWIKRRTGMRERRISSSEQASSDLMVPAAQRALQMAGKTVEEIDLIVVVWSFPDQLVPGTSDLFAEKIGAPKKLLAIDFTAQCSGFCWALDYAYDKMRSRPTKNRVVLVVSGDATSKFVDYQERETCVLFGDGAGAAVLEHVIEDGYGILGYVEACDRSFIGCLSIKAGGSAYPSSPETILRREHFMHFGPDGGAPMLTAIVRRVPELCLEVCEEAGIKPAQLKLIIPHQLNQRIIDASKKPLVKLGVSADVIYDANIARFGNCSGSSIAMALDTAYREGRFEHGDYIQLQTYGAGLKYAGIVIRWWLERYQG